MTLEQAREYKLNQIKNFRNLGWLHANGFITNETFGDLSKLSINKFNGRLKEILEWATEHYKERGLAGS